MLGVFFPAPLGGSTTGQSFMLASKTERFWWICGICRSTIMQRDSPGGSVGEGIPIRRSSVEIISSFLLEKVRIKVKLKHGRKIKILLIDW